MNIHLNEQVRPDQTRQRSGKAPASVAKAEPTAAAESSESQSPQVTQDKAAMQALVSSLRNEFAQAGIVPPPQNYAGIRLVQPSDLAGSEDEHTSAKLGAMDKMRMIMVKGMLSRMAGGETQSGDSELDLAV